MARIRSLKPEYATSEAIAALTLECELHFAKLWTYCDDHGRALDNPRLIKAAIWPLRDEVTVERIEEWQDELEKHDRIIRYTWNGKHLFEVVNWSEHQKPQHAKDSLYPSFDSEDVFRKPHEDFRKPHEASPKKAPVVGEGEGVGEGVGEVEGEGTRFLDFERFWNAYPTRSNGSKGSKKLALAAWKSLSQPKRQVALERLPTYAAANRGFTKDAERYLKHEMWDSVEEPTVRRSELPEL